MGKAEKPEKTNKKQKHFWKDFKAELKKVIWPTRNQVVNNTIVVVDIVLVITAIVFVLDLAFEALNTYGIDKLKTVVQDSIVTDKDASDKNTKNETENNTDNEDTQSNNDGDNNVSDDENTADDTMNVENVS